jgi:dihydrofolate synthase / folylpolyglutamate synthase
MDYNQAYNYLISLSNLPRKEYLKDSKHCDIYLKRLQFLLNLIGNPEKKIPQYVHVTGTSGKGSVCCILTSILKQSGKKVGTITSPSPSIITERWEINNKPINKKSFVKLIEFIKPKLDIYLQKSPYDVPSFFEIITALGLLFFAKEKIDWAVIETGMGGRYDSTNIIPRKKVCVITNIGTDHKEIIGPTKKDIAYEKAGIIKPGCKVFTMEKNKEMLNVIEKECKNKKTKLNIIDDKPKFKIIKQDLSGTKFIYQNNEYYLPVIGKHQIKNAVLAIEIAKELKIPNNIIKKGLQHIKLPLRMEVVSEKPTIILDGAHNPDKIKTTTETIKQINNQTNKQNHLIVGFADDKDWTIMINQLSKLKPKTIACTRFTINPFRKTTNPKEIGYKFKKLLPQTKIKNFLDPSDAFDWSKKQAKTRDLILATGSFFLSGEIRSII